MRPGCVSVAAGTALLLSGVVLAADVTVNITVSNPTSDDWAEVPVIVKWTDDMTQVWGAGCHRLGDPDPVAFQRDDLDGDGKIDELVFLVALKAGEARQYQFTSEGPDVKTQPRAAARMSLKGFDGPAWESDVVAYRIYWNADNAMDIFGKTRAILSLDHWAKPGVPHNIEDEHGLDVLKVGRALGIGGFGAWIDGRIQKVSNVMKTCHIRANGPLRAVVDLEYVYWQPGPFPDLSRQAITSNKAAHYDLWVRMSICAGQKWSEADIRVRPYPGSPMPEIVTGLPKHEDTALIQDKAAGILGRWGLQALGDRDALKAGNLGLGVVADPRQIVAFGEDDSNTYVRLRPDGGRVRYRYHGSWFKEPGAAKSAKEYEEMLRAVARLRPEVKVEPR
ncbi:MAG: DUF4861 domain-containing protein [Planctomycetes bacterium]|nr:DUF4861 domain-containing protein [Planctomycetota bacterium]